MPRIKLTGLLTASLLAAGFTIAGAVPAAARGSFTCAGGSVSSPTVIPAGIYSSISVTGFCTPDVGTVTVQKNLTIASGAAFLSMDASSTVTIDGNVDVQPGGSLAMGCGPSFDTPCPEGDTATSNDSIHGNLGALDAALLIIHYDTIGGNVGVAGGGGGVTCDSEPGEPDYVDFASNTIGGNASVTGLRTCWAGFSANTIGRNATYDDNQTFIDDGNYVGGNTIARNLSCFGNSPTPHLSDLGPDPNTVGGHTEGQCVGEVTPG